MKKVISILLLLLATGAIGYTPPPDKLPPIVGPPPADAGSITIVTGQPPGTPPAALVKTDSFTGTENPLATNWSTGYGLGAMQKSGVAKAATNETMSAAYWDADSFNANQYSQVVNMDGAYGYSGPCVRVAAATAANGLCALNGAANTIEITDLSSYVTALTTRDCGSTLTGATIKISVSGTGASKTVKVYRNGSQCGTDYTTSAGPNSGQPGIAAYYNGGNGVDDWEGGNL
jgi:hypothetical protein